MAKARHYQCKKEECGHKWWQEYQGGDGTNQVFCPVCGDHKGKMHPVTHNTCETGKFGKAAGVMQNMLEKDYGMTNLKDNLREGDVAAMVSNPVAQASQQMGGMFAPGTAVPAQAGGGMNAQNMLAGAKAYTEQSNREGRNPMRMFHEGAKKGYVPDTLAMAKSKAIRHTGSNPAPRRNP